jgi:hypothetical protein
METGATVHCKADVTDSRQFTGYVNSEVLKRHEYGANKGRVERN